jgi:hypothetical protein
MTGFICVGGIASILDSLIHCNVLPFTVTDVRSYTPKTKSHSSLALQLPSTDIHTEQDTDNLG